MAESVSAQQLQSIVFLVLTQIIQLLFSKHQTATSSACWSPAGHSVFHNAFLQIHRCKSKRFPSFETLGGFTFEAEAGSVDSQLQHHSVSLTAQTEEIRSRPTQYITITSFHNISQNNLLKPLTH